MASPKVYLVLLGIALCDRVFATFSASECNLTKSCFSLPENCDPIDASCAFFSWKWNGTAFEMELSGGSGNNSYVAVGFSQTGMVQGSDVYFCTGDNLGSTVIDAARTAPTTLTSVGISNVVAAVTNGLAHCTFTRAASVRKTISTGPKNFDLSAESYYILLARGNTASGELQSHGSNRGISLSRVDMIASTAGAAGTPTSHEKSTGTTPSNPATLSSAAPAAQPTSNTLMVKVVFQDNGVQFEHNVPIERATSDDAKVQFIWDLGDWSKCSTSCAGGTQRSSVICKRTDNGTVVQHSYCNPDTMPTEKLQSCNLEPCEAQWSIGQWKLCSSTCGGGERTRVISCQRKLSTSEDEIIDDKLCPGEKPVRSESCNADACPPQWVAKSWNKCSAECGIGWKKRNVVCMSSDATEGYPSYRCNATRKPPTGARCSAGECPPARWHTGRWGRCNTQCGHGRQMRKVVCLTHQIRRSLQCPVSERPSNMKTCQAECGTAAPAAVDAICEDDPKFVHCHLVLKFNFCRREYFRKMCCNTCSR